MKPEANCEPADPLELPTMNRDEKRLVSPAKARALRPWAAAICSVAALAALVLVPLFHSAESRVCAIAAVAVEAVMPSAAPSTSNTARLNAMVADLSAAYERAATADEAERSGMALADVYLRLHRKVDARKLLESMAGNDSIAPERRRILGEIADQLR